MTPRLPVTCTICGKAGDYGLCEKCQRSSRLDRVLSLFPYSETIIQSLIKTAKYSGNFDALRCYSELFVDIYRRAIPTDDWVFSFVPLSREREKKRGFNQAEELARLLAGKDYPVKNTLRKVKDTPAQAKQNRDIRLKNIRGSFAAVDKAPKNIVLCDDVITTGSTLKEAAKVLKRAGTKQVIALTIAHG